jgi:phenylpropionate dioxygenase-like ring-hydroxylating dioxygenase large terminal subunit
MTTPVLSTKRSPFPVPKGWFQIGWPDELAAGESKPLQYFGRHQVWWRDEDGVGHLQDAFCPHLGAHLGHGGKVLGCEIACPFHGWRFDADGTNTLIPYSTRTNTRETLHTYPIIERNGIVMAWYHPDNMPPEWEIPEFEPFNSPEGFTEMQRRIYDVNAPWQELAENGVDAAHFRYVHNTEVVPELESYETDGPVALMRSIQKFPTPRGVVDGRIESDSHGPGFSFVCFTGIVDTYLMGCNTPIDDQHCEMRFNFTVRKLGDDSINSTVGDAFVSEVDRQVKEDRPIWENKAHLTRPALADTDGPIMKFRKWASQFYDEPVDASATVYPPDGSYPAEELELSASQKYGSKPIA